MKTVKKYTNKFTALVLSSLLVISAFTGLFGISSFAAFEKVTNVSSVQIPASLDIENKNHISEELWCYIEQTDTENQKGANLGTDSRFNDGSLGVAADLGSIDKNAGVRTFAVYDNGAVVDNTSNGNGSVYMDMYYDLRSMANLDHLIIGNHSNAALTLGKFDVFIGTCIDDLFEGDPYVTIDNTVTYRAGGHNRINIINFDRNDPATSQARTIGIRIYDPVSTHNPEDDPNVEVTATKNYIYPRISEFAVYGDYIDPDFDPFDHKGFTDLSKVDLTKLPSEYGKSILTNTEIMGANGSDSLSNTQKNNIKAIVDRSAELEMKHIDDINIVAGKNFDFAFAINKGESEVMRVDGFAFNGIAASNYNFATSHYQVYLADDYGSLYTPDSMVYEYHATMTGDEEANGDEFITNGQLVEFDEPLYGNYLGFRILDPVYTSKMHAYGRISFIYAWGRGAELASYQTNVSANMPVDAYFTDEDGKIIPVSDANLTTQELRNITDGNIDTYAKIDTKADNRDNLTLLYNLCADVDVEALDFSAFMNSTIGARNISVYAGKTLLEVEDEDSLIWGYVDENGTNGMLTKTKRFNNKPKARYVRIVFSGTKDYVQLNEFKILGQSKQGNVDKNLTSALKVSNISVYKTVMETGEATVYSDVSERIRDMIDGNPQTFMPLLWGTVGVHKYDMLIALEDLRTVNRLKLDFIANYQEYWPTKVNLYVGETYSKAYSESAVPTYTITTKDIEKGNGIADISIKPTMGRFVRIEFVDFAKNERYIDDDGRQMIASALAEFEVYGTTVKGTQTDASNDVLMSFNVPEHKMRIDIIRLDYNDIFARLADVRVTPEDATPEQLWSLNSAPYMKIFNKKVYKIEFLDIYGNVLKDLDDRWVNVAFDTVDGFAGNSAVIANANDPECIEPYETTEVGNTYTASIDWNKKIDNKVAYCGYISDRDDYWLTLPSLEEEEEEEDSSEGEVEIDPIIHTTDGRFDVEPFTCSEFLADTKFTATDIADTASDDEYYAVLEYAYGKKVAAFYEMELTYNDSPVELDGFVSITINLPDYVTENFTDFEIALVNGSEVSFPYFEMDGNSLTFQTDVLGRFAIIGTALDGSSSINDGSF